MQADDDGIVMIEDMQKLEKMSTMFQGYCNELVVFGSNFAGFDVKLIQKFLFEESREHGQQPTFTVKKSGKYPCIKTEHSKISGCVAILFTWIQLEKFFQSLWCFRTKRFLSL